MALEDKAHKLHMDHLIAGNAYEVRRSSNLVDWSTAATITADSTTFTWTVMPTDQPHAFFQIVEKAN